MPQTRQLAAIVFTDIVGYTALMDEDEEKALQLLEQNRGIQGPLIEQHGGKWIKELGDGVLASFPSAVDAVSCACAINNACEKVDGLRLRIGIHLGDVVFENNDVFGDGVNIASRLQALAPVGSIWISEAVYKTVSNKKEIRTRFVREGALKNVKEPVRIYEIATGAGEPLSKSQPLKRVSAIQRPSRVVYKNRKPFIVTGIIVLLLAALVLWYWFSAFGHTKQIRSIAVLPFVNDSRNTDLEYLSDGMTETLIRSLSQLPNLNVKARSSVFRYKGKEKDAQTIGKELNVQAVLNGRLVQRGDALTLYLELVDAATSNQLWGEEYNRKTADLISLQIEVARDVTDKLRIKLSGTEEQKLVKNYTANAEAYKLYLKGRYYFNKRTLKDYDKSIEYYQQAIAVDLNYALAYVGLADSYTSPLALVGTPSPEKMLKAREAATKALALDDKLAEAHAAFGRVLTVYDYDFSAAEREFPRAIALNPAYALTYERYATLLAYQGRWEEAFTQIRRAMEIEPLNLNFQSSYGLILMYARRYDDAIAQLKKTLELDANFPFAHSLLSFTYGLKGDYAQSVQERAKVLEINGDTQKAALVRESFAKGGWTGFLRTAIRGPIESYLGFGFLAFYYTALGEKDSAFAALNKAFENREPLSAIKVDPRFDPLRNDTRFQELVQRIGIK